MKPDRGDREASRSKRGGRGIRPPWTIVINLGASYNQSTPRREGIYVYSSDWTGISEFEVCMPISSRRYYSYPPGAWHRVAGLASTSRSSSSSSSPPRLIVQYEARKVRIPTSRHGLFVICGTLPVYVRRPKCSGRMLIRIAYVDF